MAGFLTTLTQHLLLCQSSQTAMPVTVAARSKAWTVFACSDAGIVGSNPTQGMDVWCVCMHLFCVCVTLCLGSGLATGWSRVQGALPSVKMITELNKKPGPNRGLKDPSEKKTVMRHSDRRSPPTSRSLLIYQSWYSYFIPYFKICSSILMKLKTVYRIGRVIKIRYIWFQIFTWVKTHIVMV
jgi:hypothetical protein